MTAPPLEYPPHVLRDYALLADGERGALCGPRGDVAWLCATGWDDEAVFSTLVGGAGVYAVTPAEDAYVWGGWYEPGTLIWRHHWVTTGTVLECRDALAYPGDPDRIVLLRRIEAGADPARVTVLLDARAGFGTRPMRDPHRDRDGRWTARTGDLRLRWTGGGDAKVRDGRLVLDLTVPAGRRHDLVLEISQRELPGPPDPDRAWAATEHAWTRAVPEFAGTVAPRDARHSYAVLQGLTSSGGGMVAAATLGLPERADAGRNYDYRYVWLRDQCYAGIAAAVDEPHPLLDAATGFTAAQVLTHGDKLAPAYRVDGAPLPEESRVDIPGYPGGADIVGNRVTGQFQVDVLGELLQLYAAAAGHDRLDGDGLAAARVVAGLVEDRWERPDAGVWELDDGWWTHSRLACVAGLRAMAARLPRGDGARLDGLADTILAETSRRCLRDDGAWRRSPDHHGTDAALLLPPVRGALPAADPRTVATRQEVRAELGRDGYLYRFVADDRPLGQAEGAFLLCGFTMALAAHHQGETTEAFRWFERTRAACGPPGLFAEEWDVDQRQLRGNLPQGFVHAAMLEAAQRLAGPTRGGGLGETEVR
ncbi:MAG: glycoside hydrolase family 15 protein [Mycobacteriales bacterium]